MNKIRAGGGWVIARSRRHLYGLSDGARALVACALYCASGFVHRAPAAQGQGTVVVAHGWLQSCYSALRWLTPQISGLWCDDARVLVACTLYCASVFVRGAPAAHG